MHSCFHGAWHRPSFLSAHVAAPLPSRVKVVNVNDKSQARAKQVAFRATGQQPLGLLFSRFFALSWEIMASPGLRPPWSAV